MNKIKKIGISGVGPFKKGVLLPILPGISVLYGRNDLAGGNANAVGKSLIGRVPQMIFYEPEVRADKKQGKRVIVFEKGTGKERQEVKVVVQSGKNEDYKLLVNGEDKSARKKTATKAEMISKWGLTQDEFQTFGIVDASVPHPLVKGGTAARKAFFTSFFGLDRMDAEKKVFMKELSDIKKAKAAHAEVATAFDAARRDMLTKDERQSLQAEVEELELKVKKLTKLQDKASASQRVEAFISVAGPQLKALKKRPPREASEVAALLKDAEALEEQIEDYRDYLKAKKAYDEAVQGLDMETPIKELAEAAKKYRACKDRIEDFADRKPPRFSMEKPQTPGTPRDELEAEARRLRHSLNHSKKFAKGVCETCGQEVEVADPAKTEKRLRKIDQQLELWDEVEDYTKKRKAYKEEQATYDAEEQEIKKLKSSLKGLKAKAQLYDKRRVLSKPERVEKPSGEFDVSALKEELALAKFKEENESLIEATATFTPVEFDHRKLSKAQERLFAARARLDLHKAVKKRADQLRDRLAELEEMTKRQQQLEIILEGYADKAMKRMAIESISTHLMASVNRYAALVFENYSFEFVWGTQIQLIVHRPEGSSDVRMLSGAESILFTIILILSLLTFVPQSKRLNLLILDEPTASFSETTQDLFVKLLPHINLVIPSVLIITPKTDFKIAGANNFTVVKTADGSIIKEGHANEV
jgi:DNA repair exonuclease SbcCD ATPase subunit